jgi:hypothetical protein
MKNCHVVTELFPLMAGIEFDEFCRDIATNGLKDPIDLWHGMIIDGRNREHACAKTGVRAIYRDWTGTEEQLIAYVVSKNLRRRHLTTTQRASLGVQLIPLLEGAALQRQLAGTKASPETKGRAVDHAARMTHVAPASIWRMRQVLESAIPKIKTATFLDQIPLATAADISKLSRTDQMLAKILPRPSKNAQIDPRGVNFLLHDRTIRILDRMHEKLGGNKSRIVEKAILAMAKRLNITLRAKA